jgi:hypothetical protein
MTEMVTSGSMSGEGKRNDGLLGESDPERTPLVSGAARLCYVTAPFLDSTSRGTVLEPETNGFRCYISEPARAFRTFIGESDMLAYLSMMAPRLMELRRVSRNSSRSISATPVSMASTPRTATEGGGSSSLGICGFLVTPSTKMRTPKCLSSTESAKRQMVESSEKGGRRRPSSPYPANEGPTRTLGFD